MNMEKAWIYLGKKFYIHLELCGLEAPVQPLYDVISKRKIYVDLTPIIRST